MGEKETPAGLGRIYVTTADDKKLEHLQPIECHATDLKCIAGDGETEHGGYSKNGWTITATARLDSPKDDKTLKKFIKTMMSGSGRLPRKEKKRRVNRVMRDREELVKFAVISLGKTDTFFSLAACMLFPERILHDKDSKQATVYMNTAQHRLVSLFMKRIVRNAKKILRREWNRDRHHGVIGKLFCEA
ncbi:MAG: hypothetical protein IKQ37_04040 [Bacteroidaceae bacterium]|nr:hypothetical protein [Bacteroidaceae bacterium]